MVAGALGRLRIAGVGVLILRRSGALEIRKGTTLRTLQLPKGARLHDFAEGVLAVRAALDPSGLLYADDQRVHHVSTQRVAAAVAGG